VKAANLVLLGVGAMAQATLVLGDETPKSAPSGAVDSIPEIIVTAQKRAENLQDVPLAVTAVTGDTLQNRLAI
jgi:iron complex outermembrane receptor protein